MIEIISSEPEVSLRAYARHRGISLKAVQKAIASGRIHKSASGKIAVAGADRAWAANTDMARRPVDSVFNFQTRSIDDDDSEDEVQDQTTSDYQKHRALREEIRAKKEQIELDKMTGATLDVAEANRIIFTAFRTVRDAIMNVPVRTKDLIAAETNPMRIEALLEKELASALESIDVKAALKGDIEEEETEDEGD
jgi:crotonobetainyl-CoA:carnitine CoA-transferase CaiB-like acyl-CoA transferase